MADGNNVLDLIQSNPEMVQQVANPATPFSTGGGAGQNPEEALNSEISSFEPNSWATARRARTNQNLSDGGFQDTLAHHHAAVADAESTARAMETINLLHNHAIQQQETGEALQALHGTHAGMNDYADRFSAAIDKYPNADWKRIHEIYQPMHEAWRQRQAIIGELKGPEAIKGIYAAANAGTINPNTDFPRDPQGNIVGPEHWDPEMREQMLTRAAANAQPKLTPFEEEIMKESRTNPKFNQDVLKSTDDKNDAKYDPTKAAAKAAFFSAQGKMGKRGGNAPAQTGQPVAAEHDIAPLFGR